MLRWLRTWLSAALWSYLIVGLVGLLEGLQQVVRRGVPDDWGFTPSLLRLLLPPLTLYGWFGLAVTVLAVPFAAAALLALRRPARLAWGLGVGAALSALGIVYLGYVVEQKLGGTRRWEAFWWYGPLLVLAWLVGVAILARPLRALGERLERRSPALLLVPGLLLLLTTSLWPDWRREQTALHTGGLTRLPAAAQAPADAPDVVLVSIDAMRADRLSAVNEAAPPTPNLDRLAGEAILYRRAFSAGPWTLPGMAAVMTGLPPRVLQVDQSHPLPADVPTLAEIAWRHGYRTAAFVTNSFLRDWYGFGRGFDFYEHAGVLETLLPARRSVLAREATRRAEESLDASAAGLVVPKVPWGVSWLREHGGGTPAADGAGPARARADAGGRARAPLFLWIHLLDPHMPYTWRELPPGAPAAAGRGTPPDRADVPDDGYFRGGELAVEALHAIRDGEWRPDAAEWRAIGGLYDREVSYADAWFGRLRASLERLGIWEDAVVVVLADHGEELHDHGGFEHGHTVNPEVVRVPLLLRLPDGRDAGRVVEAPVWTADVMPTLCRILGWSVPAGVGGGSFWPPPREPVRPAGPAAAEAGAAPAGVAVEGRPLLLIENMLYGPPEQGILAWPLYGRRETEPDTVTWFDLEDDPLGARPLASPAAAPALLAAADSLAAAWDRRAAGLLGTGARAEREVPEDLRRRMRALGYVR